MLSFKPNFVHPNWPLPTAVIAHDAGAANLIISWIKSWHWPVYAFVDGPALKLWRYTFPNQMICQSIDEALSKSSSVVTGTGWASGLEHLARRKARKYGLPVAAAIDHWVNYKARFEWEGEKIWPDEFWVADQWAAHTAQLYLPSRPIHIFENLYMKSEVAKISCPPEDGTLLYVLEPVRNNWGRKLQGEFQALDYTLEQLERLPGIPIRKIILRPHPSDPVNKYNFYLKSESRIKLDCNVTISQSISQADIVIGVESFALPLALAAGRPVFSSLPPWAPPLRLPQEGIRELRRVCLK